MGKSILCFRCAAFHRQGGCCHYCGVRMWLDDGPSFARRHSISVRQAEWLKCTAEHLRSRQDGGEDTAENIVAACLRCNRLRHQGRRKAPEPETYLQHVRRQLSRKVWHRAAVFERGLIATG